MAIVKMEASKATPVKAIDYVTDRGKSAQIGVLNLDTSRDFARQMMETAQLWGKAQGADDRKYYHFKLSFSPKDWEKNGGTLNPRKALDIGTEIMKEFFPTHEGVMGAHIDKGHLHVHGIVNAVDMENGKMLDMRQHQYRRMKDRIQEICEREGLQSIDWRKATKEKRQRERQPDRPVVETFAERSLQERGETSWKAELRQIIDDAAGSCTTMDEFKAALASQNVTLTRCTEQTISYKMGEHRACRGDTLGGDYTVAAIRNALGANAYRRNHGSLDAMIESASRRSADPGAGRVIDKDERALYRSLGRAAGIKRAEVDAMCDQASKATWEEKQNTWQIYREAKEEFWDEFKARQRALQREISASYKKKKKVRNAEWALDPRNRRKSLIGVVYAMIVLSRNKPSDKIQRHIEYLKNEQSLLRTSVNSFKRATGEALETLKERDLPLENYMEAVQQLQFMADQIHHDFSVLDPKKLDRAREKVQEEKPAEKPAQEGTMAAYMDRIRAERAAEGQPGKRAVKRRKTLDRER